jgi:hypothetical protein
MCVAMMTNEAMGTQRRTAPLLGVAVAMALACATGCGGKAEVASGSPDGDSAGDTGMGSETSIADAMDAGQPDRSPPPTRVPLYHRPDDSQCTAPRSAGSCTAGMMGPPFVCSTDSQCADGGADGRCTNSPGGPAGCFCTYDACGTDNDCPSGQLCVCHDSAYNHDGNTCLPGNCRVDADCGPGGYCSPAHGTNDCGGVNGYYCHTPQDQCIDDSDCAGQGFDVCSWSAQANRWECQMAAICA